MQCKVINSGGELDTPVLRDSAGDDTLIALPTQASFQMPNSLHQLTGFAFGYASGSTGNDTATFVGIWV